MRFEHVLVVGGGQMGGGIAQVKQGQQRKRRAFVLLCSWNSQVSEDCESLIDAFLGSDIAEKPPQGSDPVVHGCFGPGIAVW